VEQANSTEIKAEQPTQNATRTAIESGTAKSDQEICSSADPVFRKRHLDVDAVLARSLRKVASE
jgi:hypothetical protein